VLWVLIISGGLLGLEGIAQRLSDSPKLLFLVKPEIHQSALTQFASYAYRANAAQYFNLLWPVALGFWWLKHPSGRSKSIARHVLLLSALIMAACPIISTARGAAMVDVAMLLAAALLLVIAVFSSKYIRSRASSAAWVIFFLIGALALGMGLGWNQLRPRLVDLPHGIDEREQFYERVRLVARDYPLFGTGPGTFDRVFQLYRFSTGVYWPAQAHNDWLETRVTFGWIGSALIALGLGVVLRRVSIPGGIRTCTHFIPLMWLALAGCLVQARWDFPLQVYSILFLFLVWCAVLFNLSLRE
jgi:putative inorganic carbon (HCO3(-)) transporter